MIAKLLTLSRILRESVPFGVALSDDECARSDASRELTRLADVLSAASAARWTVRCALDDARSIAGNPSYAEMAAWGKATNELAAARSCADDGLRAAALLLVAAA